MNNAELNPIKPELNYLIHVKQNCYMNRIYHTYCNFSRLLHSGNLVFHHIETDIPNICHCTQNVDLLTYTQLKDQTNLPLEFDFKLFLIKSLIPI